MQALLQKFDDSDKEKEDEVNRDYFRRNERKSDQDLDLLQVDSEAKEDAQMEHNAKAAIMKDILANFQFVQTSNLRLPVSRR